MSDFVVTEASSITCGFVDGAVGRNALNTKLFVDGRAVVVAGEIVGAPVTGCTHATDSAGNKGPCTTVLSRTGGEATKLFVQGRAALVSTLGGTTDGMSVAPPPPGDPTAPPAPPGPVSISVTDVGQSKLKTG